MDECHRVVAWPPDDKTISTDSSRLLHCLESRLNSKERFNIGQDKENEGCLRTDIALEAVTACYKGQSIDSTTTRAKRDTDVV